MDPLVAFLVAALTGVGGYSAAITYRYIKHLERENAALMKQADRGTRLGERGAIVAERAARIASQKPGE